jgi:hypothetical protein
MQLRHRHVRRKRSGRGDAASQHPRRSLLRLRSYRSGLDGNLYAWDSLYGSGIYRFDRASNQWVRVLGDGTRGVNPVPRRHRGDVLCSGGQRLLRRHVGHLYFISLGQLRVVVAALESDGVGGLIERRRVRTLAGQGLYYGDGGDALSARFSMITSAKRWIDAGQEKIVVHDLVNARMREITVGGAVATIAGNGNVGFRRSTSTQGRHRSPRRT